MTDLVAIAPGDVVIIGSGSWYDFFTLGRVEKVTAKTVVVSYFNPKTMGFDTSSGPRTRRIVVEKVVSTDYRRVAELIVSAQTHAKDVERRARQNLKARLAEIAGGAK